MNCPECDSLIYKSDCGCGWKSPPISTIQIKQMGAQETKFPLKIDEKTEELLKNNPVTGKERAKLCIEYMNKILKEASIRNLNNMRR